MSNDQDQEQGQGQDACGYPTASGEPCQNPAGDNGHCWIPSHAPDGTIADGGSASAPGRPSKYTEERARTAIEAAEKGVSKAGCARAAGIGEATLDRWTNPDNDYTVTIDGHARSFRSAFTQARARGEQRLVDDGLYDDSADAQMARFLLSTSFDYVKTEKREHEHSGEVDGFTFNINSGASADADAGDSANGEE